VNLTRRVLGEVKVDAFYYHYDDFLLLRSRLGSNVGVGVSLDY
jgi:hypothetical protein